MLWPWLFLSHGTAEWNLLWPFLFQPIFSRVYLVLSRARPARLSVEQAVCSAVKSSDGSCACVTAAINIADTIVIRHFLIFIFLLVLSQPATQTMRNRLENSFHNKGEDLGRGLSMNQVQNGQSLVASRLFASADLARKQPLPVSAPEFEQFRCKPERRRKRLS